jgi:hypothetical protein
MCMILHPAALDISFHHLSENESCMPWGAWNENINKNEMDILQL